MPTEKGPPSFDGEKTLKHANQGIYGLGKGDPFRKNRYEWRRTYTDEQEYEHMYTRIEGDEWQ